jgi:predicted outer membrane protein
VRPPVPRFVRWVVSLAVIAALTVVMFQYWTTSQYGVATVSDKEPSETADVVWTQTQWGPLSPADRDLLVMIRQAGLCGGPSGQQAQQQGATVGVRTVAKRVWVDYGDLGNQARAVAGKLGVALPDQPNAQQQSWMRELSGRSGPDFDRTFAQGLHVTDGAVLPTITSVRAGTRNELIRSFAATAAVLLNRQMEYLEHTGLVGNAQLPAPQPPAAVLPAAAAASSAPLADIPPAGREQRIDQVVNANQVPPTAPVAGNDAKAMIAALVSIAVLLVALGLLGTSGRRVRPARQTDTRPQHRSTSHTRRHAAQRW